LVVLDSALMVEYPMLVGGRARTFKPQTTCEHPIVWFFGMREHKSFILSIIQPALAANQSPACAPWQLRQQFATASVTGKTD